MVNRYDNRQLPFTSNNILRVLYKSYFILKIIFLFIAHLSILLYISIKSISFFDTFDINLKKIDEYELSLVYYRTLMKQTIQYSGCIDVLVYNVGLYYRRNRRIYR